MMANTLLTPDVIRRATALLVAEATGRLPAAIQFDPLVVEIAEEASSLGTGLLTMELGKFADEVLLPRVSEALEAA